MLLLDGSRFPESIDEGQPLNYLIHSALQKCPVENGYIRLPQRILSKCSDGPKDCTHYSGQQPVFKMYCLGLFGPRIYESFAATHHAFPLLS